jgi:opacity protein-like surface antigen
MKEAMFMMLVAAFLCSARAEDEGARREVYFGTGISFPVYPETFSNVWNTGYNFGGGLFTSISSIAQFGVGIEYNNFAYDIKRVYALYGLNANGVAASGGSASIILVSPMIKIRFSRARDRISGYALLGIGYFHVSTGDLTIDQGNNVYTLSGDSHSAVAVHLGIGVDVPVNDQLGILFQGEFINGFTDVQATQYIPVRAGMRFAL